MSTEQNKALVRRWIEEAINKQNLALVDELFTSDYVNHYFPPGLPQGPEGEKIFSSGFFTAFPDGSMTIENLLAEGDQVAVRWIYSGTHTGPLMTPGGALPPTGKKFSAQGVNIFRIAGERIAENWASFDMLGLLQQLGAVPAGV
jgi:steroid delta-isomerase-like uncharacterized protein